jgi:hypothetical protein
MVVPSTIKAEEKLDVAKVHYTCSDEFFPF